jgi:hypothetical protein
MIHYLLFAICCLLLSDQRLDQRNRINVRHGNVIDSHAIKKTLADIPNGKQGKMLSKDEVRLAPVAE